MLCVFGNVFMYQLEEMCISLFCIYDEVIILLLLIYILDYGVCIDNIFFIIFQK